MKKQVYNPFLPLDTYIPDGEAHVFGDRVYLFGSHDKEGGDTFCMEDYEFFSAPVDDLTDWSSKGPNYSPKQDPLYGEDADFLYAPDVVRGNDGRYYLYYCLAGRRGKGGYSHPISVAVSDEPDGKYEFLGHVKAPDGTPYLEWVCFDPAVINDDGIIRIYFGSGPFSGREIKPWNALWLTGSYSKTFGKPKETFRKGPGPLGANAAALEDDMLTLKEMPKRICDSDDFKGHLFFEAASIRKIADTYYFVYSSQWNHELCYATSKYPDRDFRFGGTIVSNGDVGFEGRREKDRNNATGTTHGSIEQIDGQWYVFYHRLTHGCDYSRQACAEKIEIEDDGSIRQVRITSCGLNDGDLEGEGEYPAVICCSLTNGRMPHMCNQVKTGIPVVTNTGEERFVRGMDAGTEAVYRYFDLSGTQSADVTARGKGALEVIAGDEAAGILRFDSDGWTELSVPMTGGKEHSALTFRTAEGELDILTFRLNK